MVRTSSKGLAMSEDLSILLWPADVYKLKGGEGG